VAIDAPSPPVEDAGIGGLFAHGEPADSAPAPTAPKTSVFPVAAAPPTPAVPPQPQRFAYWTDSVQTTEDDEGDHDAPGSGRRIALFAGLALVVVAALAIVGWMALRDDDDDPGGTTASETTAAEPAEAEPQPGDVQEAGGVQFTLQAAEVDETCAGNAYGDTQAFLDTNDCTGLSRALYSAELEGGAVVVSVSRVQMPDNAIARELQALTDRNGSGNVSDLLREGVRYSGSPAELSGAEYASAVSGSVVTIVESAWVEEDSEGGSAEIDQAATYGLEFATPPFPTE
jgi:hypothetical protein